MSNYKKLFAFFGKIKKLLQNLNYLLIKQSFVKNVSVQ